METATKSDVSLQDAIESVPVAPEFEARYAELIDVARHNLLSVDEAVIRKSFLIAYWAHIDGKRASGEPYITHPLEVALILARDIHFDDTCVAAALLHDVVEDNSAVSVADIRHVCGEPLATIVDGLTKIQAGFENRELRQAENFRKLMLSMASDIRVILVKFGDRLHNMRTLSSLPENKQLKIASETLELFAPLAHRFGLYALKNELEDLCLKALDPEPYYEISKGLNAKKKQRAEYVKRFIKPIAEELEPQGFRFDIYGRPKHLYSIYRKMRSQNKTLDEIYDLFAIRIILESEGKQGKEDCWRAYSVVTDLYQPLPERFRDFISVPKSNGYQSLHTTVLGHDGKRVEIQIRTREMHEIAEFGVAAHWKYKEGPGTNDPSLDTRYEWVRDLLENPDSERATEFVEEFQRDLAGEEIYVFTPAGDLMTLPKGATPVDFAFRVHTQVGYHCNGARVNDRVVPLSEKLRSGDQVEILTSKRKTPNAAWMQFVVTQKAKSRIRHWLNEKRREFVKKGQEAWEKKAHRKHISLTEHDLQRLAVKMKFANTQELYYEIGKGLLDPSDVARMADQIKEQRDERQAELLTDENVVRIAHERFLDQAQAIGQPALLIEGEGHTGIATQYASCCNPIPGDAVFGYLTREGVIKIHRKTCVNSAHLFKSQDRIMKIEWTRQKDVQFMAALRIVGEDRVGMISDITDSISKGFKTNIRSISVESTDGVFEGSLVLDVMDLKHLKKVMQRLRRIKGVVGVYRFDEPRGAREQR